MNQPNMIKSGAMPQQSISGMPPGSTSTMNAGLILQQQQINKQMALIGKSGGSKKSMIRRRFHGGAVPVIQVPPVTSGAVNPQQTGANYKELSILAENQATKSTYDNAKTPAQTAAIQQQQQTLYKGGSKRGGSWSRWGCLSGGKKSKRRRNSCKRYSYKRHSCKRHSCTKSKKNKRH
jgi:hypothetical protein